MIKPEILDALQSIYHIDPKAVNTLTEEQKASLHAYAKGIVTYGILYTDTLLIFTSERTLENWKEAAGFKYFTNLPAPLTYTDDEKHIFIVVYDSEQEPDGTVVQNYLSEILNA